MSDSSRPADDRRSGSDTASITFWWISTGFVVAVVLAVVAIVIFGDGGAPESAASPPSTAPSSSPPGDGPSPSAESSASTSGRAKQPCRAKAGDAVLPINTPTPITWKLASSKIAVPYSPSHGPLQSHGHLAQCYSRDPVGALVAGSQIIGRMSDPKAAAEIYDHQVVPGPAVEKAKKQLAAGKSQDPANYERPQFVGFRYLSYDDSEATVIFVLDVGQKTYPAATFVTVWRNGQWMLDLDQSQAAATFDVPETELSQYVSWSGVR